MQYCAYDTSSITRDKFNSYVIELRRVESMQKSELETFRGEDFRSCCAFTSPRAVSSAPAGASQHQQLLDQRSLRLWLCSPVQRARHQDHALGEEPTPTPTPSSLPPLLDVRSRRPRSLFLLLSLSIPLSPLATLASHPPPASLTAPQDLLVRATRLVVDGDSRVAPRQFATDLAIVHVVVVVATLRRRRVVPCPVVVVGE